MNRITWALLVGAMLLGMGCQSLPHSSYARYRMAYDRHDAVVAYIESIGGKVMYEQNAAAVTLNDLDRRQVDEALRRISELAHVDSVTMIDCKLTDWELGRLHDVYPLRYLAIRHARLTESGINQIRHLPNLTVVHLVDVGLDDYRLVDLMHIRGIEELAIAYEPNVTDRSIRRLDRMHKLHTLTLTETSASEQTVRDLTEALPKLVAVYNGQQFRGQGATR